MPDAAYQYNCVRSATHLPLALYQQERKSQIEQRLFWSPRGAASPSLKCHKHRECAKRTNTRGMNEVGGYARNRAPSPFEDWTRPFLL